MQTVTIACPTPGLEAYFKFKEPVTRSLQNRLGVSSTQFMLRVSAINEIKEMLQSELRDPFLEAYAPAGLEQAQYTQDLMDNIHIVTFQFTASNGTVKYVRIPLSYLEGYDSVAEITYLDRNIVIGLGGQFVDLDTEILHADLVDFIQSRTGITATIREVSLGDPISVSVEEHTQRETIRQNSITVVKSTQIQLEEMRQKYQGLVDRINQLGIVLGE